jgi:hypothetical protein
MGRALYADDMERVVPRWGVEVFGREGLDSMEGVALPFMEYEACDEARDRCDEATDAGREGTVLGGVNREARINIPHSGGHEKYSTLYLTYQHTVRILTL